MNNDVLKFLKNNYTSDPFSIDRLFVSAFLKGNRITVKHNILIKSYLINSDKEELYNLDLFLDVLGKNDVKLNFENLINLFEFVISPADRVINGAIYTPLNIREFITNSTFNEIAFQPNNFRIADISCGCGGFLFNVTKVLRLKNISFRQIYSSYIFGLDIQSYSITRTKLLLSLLAIHEGEDIKEFDFNLFVGDALSFNWRQVINNFNGFNIIVGNPPYVRLRNLNDSTKKLLQNWEVCRTGLTDLYIPFFQIAIENLSDNGLLGYITMNSFFKSLNGRALRDYFHRKSLKIKIIDFGSEQIFKSKNTYTCICFIQNQNQEFIEYTAIENKKLNKKVTYSKIRYLNLDSFKGWNLKSNKIISKIESIGTPFGNLYRTRHGIATLKNNIYIFKPIKEDIKYYYKQSKNGPIAIEKNICKNIVNSNKLGSGQDINKITEVIIFPYSEDTKPKLITEENFAANYPHAYDYLTKQKSILGKRDKEKGKYENWFAFGRTQSLERIQNKLFFPKISNRPPNCIIASDKDLFYYNGQAIIGHTIEDLIIIKKIMESKLFWYYIENTSKPYSSNYYSLNGNYISNFGICELNEQERKYIIEEENKDLLNTFFESKYDIHI